MGTKRILRRALEIKFKGKRQIGLPRIRWFCQILQDTKRKEMGIK
jgi:hypothetical protein